MGLASNKRLYIYIYIRLKTIDDGGLLSFPVGAHDPQNIGPLIWTTNVSLFHFTQTCVIAHAPLQCVPTRNSFKRLYYILLKWQSRSRTFAFDYRVTALAFDSSVPVVCEQPIMKSGLKKTLGRNFLTYLVVD